MDAVVEPTLVNQVSTFIDEQTGREIRQLTNMPDGAHLGYFRMYRQLPDGRMLARAKHDHGNAILIAPESGDLELRPHAYGSLKMRESDGRIWFLTDQDGQTRRGWRKTKPEGMRLCHMDLPDGESVVDAVIPNDLPGSIADITIDGRYLIIDERHDENRGELKRVTGMDVAAMTHYFQRPRRGAIWVYDTVTEQTECIVETHDIAPFHHDTSPLDPMLLRYALDMPETQGQRVWTIRVDGTDQRPIRPQVGGELVTHEFWWADANYIGYTYQDRREDPTVADHHWAEYAQAHTRLGIADLSGEEVYLSDPLNSYHSHLYRSPDGTLVSGEGTDGHSFVYAAAFDMNTTKVDMVPLATIHPEYVPFRGQGVDCNFSSDGRWLIYADQLDAESPRQLFAVAVDL